MLHSICNSSAGKAVWVKSAKRRRRLVDGVDEDSQHRSALQAKGVAERQSLLGNVSLGLCACLINAKLHEAV